MLRLRYLYIFAVLLLFVTACADDVDSASVEPTTQDAWTQVRIQRQVDAGDQATWSAEAWFAEFSGVNAEAVREAMNIIDADAPGCTLVPQPDAHHGDAAVRFLAIGAAQLTDAQGDVHTMHPRPLALRTDAVHGIVYAAHGAQHDNPHWRVELTNADGSPRLDLEQAAPTGWGVVAINGDTTFSSPFRVSENESVSLRVDTDAESSVVVLRSASNQDGAQLICGLRHDRIVLSPTLLDALGDDADHIGVQLIMHNSVALQNGDRIVGDARIELHDNLRIERTPADHRE